VLSTEEDGIQVAGEVRRRLAPLAGAEVLAVVGPPVDTPGGLPASFATARRCVELLGDLERHEGVVDARAYTPYLAMFGDGGAPLEDYIDTVIGPVLRWDEQRGGDLLRTLRSFIDSHSSPARTARVLHVHVNTVLQRLTRLTTLLGEDWREPEPLFRISVAVRLLSVRDLGGRSTH